jgi:hypothetical protein
MDLTLRIAAKTLFDADTPGDVAEIHEGFEDVLVEISARFRRPSASLMRSRHQAIFAIGAACRKSISLWPALSRTGSAHPVTVATFCRR